MLGCTEFENHRRRFRCLQPGGRGSKTDADTALLTRRDDGDQGSDRPPVGLKVLWGGGSIWFISSSLDTQQSAAPPTSSRVSVSRVTKRAARNSSQFTEQLCQRDQVVRFFPPADLVPLLLLRLRCCLVCAARRRSKWVFARWLALVDVWHVWCPSRCPL